MLLCNNSFAVTLSWHPNVQGPRLIARARLFGLLERKKVFIAGPSWSAELMVSTWHPPLGAHRRVQLRVAQHGGREPRSKPLEVNGKSSRASTSFQYGFDVVLALCGGGL